MNKSYFPCVTRRISHVIGLNLSETNKKFAKFRPSLGHRCVLAAFRAYQFRDRSGCYACYDTTLAHVHKAIGSTPRRRRRRRRRKASPFSSPPCHPKDAGGEAFLNRAEKNRLFIETRFRRCILICRGTQFCQK